MNPILALHGDFSSPERLRRDMGNPPWRMHCIDWAGFSPDLFCNLFVRPGDFLLGYSSGGSFIADLTYHCPPLSGIILYESPILNLSPKPIDCPVLMIWNNYQPFFSRRFDAKVNSMMEWTEDFQVTHLTGSLRSHTKPVPYFPFIGHGWDTNLNPVIERWINANSNRTNKDEYSSPS